MFANVLQIGEGQGLELQLKGLREDILKNLIERKNESVDLEIFDMRFVAIRNRLHRVNKGVNELLNIK